jgi:hypothetical protein
MASAIPAAKSFKVGDHVSWNSEAGRVSGMIVKVHTKDVNYKGYIHHADRDEPQYQIKSANISSVSSDISVSLGVCELRGGDGRYQAGRTKHSHNL